jgi:hypothetical protein
MSRIQTKHDAFDGNATAFDWVVDSGNIQPSADNSSIALTLNEKNMGTRISSTRYVHYGEISAKGMSGTILCRGLQLTKICSSNRQVARCCDCLHHHVEH